MALRADLRGQLVLVLEVVRPHHAHFFNAVAQRLLAVDVLAAVHGPVGHERVRVIRRAADHRLDVLLLKAFPPVHILLGLGEFPRPEVQVVLVDVAEGHHVLGGHPAEMGLTSAPGADEGNVEFVAGGVRSEEPNFREDKAGRTTEGHAFEKLASFHSAIIGQPSRNVNHACMEYEQQRREDAKKKRGKGKFRGGLGPPAG